jgi:predicted ATP-dependent serine protease
VPVDIEFLSGLYNRHSCYAERLSGDQLDAIHVNTGVEEALRKWILEKRDIVITGNPGDGKTFLLIRLQAEIAAVNGEQILDATSEKDYAAIVLRWQKPASLSGLSTWRLTMVP